MEVINGFKRITKETVSETIIKQIKDMITNGTLIPGQRLPSERELAETLSVSRPSVREAMHALKSLGIIEIKTGEGTFLKDNYNLLSDHFNLNNMLKKFSLLDLVESRRILEVAIVGLAAERGTLENKKLIQELFHKSVKQKDNIEKYQELDFAMHVAIAEASQNKFLLEMLNTTRDLLFSSNFEILQKPGQIDITMKAHQDIVDAIVRSDKKMAKKAMLLHLESIAKALKEL